MLKQKEEYKKKIIEDKIIEKEISVQQVKK